MALVLTLAGLPGGAAHAQGAVVPGRSLGRVVLGMSRADARTLLGPPSHAADFTLPRRYARAFPSGRYADDTWTRPARGVNDDPPVLDVISRDDRVVQVETTSPKFVAPGGLSADSTFGEIRLGRPHMHVDQYAFRTTGEDTAPETSTQSVFYVDDVQHGLAFATALYDEEETGNLVVGLAAVPDRETPREAQSGVSRLIVHPPGRRVLPDFSLGVLVIVSHHRGDALSRFRAWAAPKETAPE